MVLVLSSPLFLPLACSVPGVSIRSSEYLELSDEYCEAVGERLCPRVIFGPESFSEISERRAAVNSPTCARGFARPRL
jgi:hypothetical protein